MASRFKRAVLRPIRYSDRVGIFITKLFSRSLKKELCGMVTDKFLELLLRCMDLSFCLSESYLKNIKNFKGKYLFRTLDNTVAASVTFEDTDMKVHEEDIGEWDARVTFKDAIALKGFLFSRDRDILDSILRNDVEVDGNLNYIYKFGFMAKDLMRRLGVG